MSAVSTIGSVIAPFARHFDPASETKHKAFWDTVDKFGLAWLCIAAFWAVVAVRFLYAPYWLYAKILRQRDAARTALVRVRRESSQPHSEFVAQIFQALTVEIPGTVSSFRPSDVRNIPIAGIVMEIVNIGAPSMVHRYVLKVTFPNGRSTIGRLTQFGMGFDLINKDTRFRQRLVPNESLDQLTREPIPTGGMREGLVYFRFRENITLADLQQARNIFEVGFCDVWGRIYTVSLETGEPGTGEPFSLPGLQTVLPVFMQPSEQVPDTGASPPSPTS